MRRLDLTVVRTGDDYEPQQVTAHRLRELLRLERVVVPALVTAARITLTALEKADISGDTLIWIEERDLLVDAIDKAEGRS